MKNIIGLKELRQDMAKYAKKVASGQSFIVFKQSKPLFKIAPVDEEVWETVIDFTKIKKGGVDIDEITDINSKSSSFDFLKKEPDLYSKKDLKKEYV